MTCKFCQHWSTDYGYCVVCSTKPSPTGCPNNCPYYKARKG